MGLAVRKVTKDDESALSKICLLTADAGNSAESLHNHPELPGLVYAVPYVHLPTTWGFVLHDEAVGEAVGYILGSSDTRAYEAYAKEHWWPPLAEKYPPSIGHKPGDVSYANLLQNMHTAPQANIDFSPAHMHIDIVPAYQKQGWGRKLIGTAIKYLKEEENLESVWLGLDPRNTGAKIFYGKLGFNVIPGAPDDNQMGLKFGDWREST